MEQKILSISDEAFILLCLINYGKRWFAELVKTEKMVRKTKWLVQDEQQGTDLFCYHLLETANRYMDR